jgi:transposase InsO family protein
VKNLWQPSTVQELKDRLAQLRPDSPRLWGKMTPGQAVAHCAIAMELALGDRRPPRMLIGRLIGSMIKGKAFRENEPMRRNSPTIPGFQVSDDRDLGYARDILCALIDRFAASGHAGCTTHPHSFFGYLTPDEWSMWMYKHIDHHLQQFGV